MTGPFGGPSQMHGLPTPPTGWPIGSYNTYAEAQRAVDYLADNEFAVQDVTIVGVDLMLVERVLRRLTWGRVLGSGAASGAWFGLFVGVLLAVFTGNGGGAFSWVPVITGLVIGVLFGAVFGAVGYASSRGRRDFASANQLVAGRYDVLCQPRSAEQARDMLARLSMGQGQTDS